MFKKFRIITLKKIVKYRIRHVYKHKASWVDISDFPGDQSMLMDERFQQ